MNSDTVDYEDACLIVRYLASMRPFAQSFDIYLTQVNCARSLNAVKYSWFPGSKHLWGSVQCLFIVEHRYLIGHDNTTCFHVMY